MVGSFFNRNSGIVQLWERTQITYGYLYFCMVFDIFDDQGYSYAYFSDGCAADYPAKVRCPKNWISGSKRREGELE